MTIAPLTVVWPEAKSSALALPLTVALTLASIFTFSPSRLTSCLAVALIFEVASIVMAPFAFSVISFADEREIPLLSQFRSYSGRST